ncbi:methyltransferase [Methanosarcina sp. 2.H.T.1A.6]|uniref:nicotianamine synthase family protein n=1 Tax=unclassified Methanosarcina TaxID=2644672 RepID=UPI0006228E9C|nr:MULTISPECIES: nicotianamine synthase family protein [unclassified Methanosarcina]KKG13011.1 methyltransferase [Methanosarcina sp. 2.H.T.1A.15]KKG14229.1 methyltransferase [Methanosarcina sp. 2.H.T.1A.3]KKG19719.1 methyltransferase [Methanosarcina sp. 2.H.T.1A.6]KKG27106.1 methyltransferase [Methanosarcina sp. 2.H.T.1A.8]
MNNIPKIDAAPLIAELWQISVMVNDLGEKEILESSSEELHSIFIRLDELAALNVNEKSTDAILKSPDFDDLMDAISRFRFLYNLKLEIEKAKSLLESPNPWKTLRNFTFYPNYLQLARTEYTGSCLEPKDCVLFLGSGPLPLSLIVLCSEYGLSGIGIEQDGKRANLSREVIARLGLSERIKIIEGNHFILPLKISCNLYMIAAQAEPKNEVFEHLAKVIPEGSKVSYRLYEKGLRRVLDDSSLFELPSGFEEYLRVQPEPPVNNTVVFLKKR